MSKECRFNDLVKRSGHPEVVTLWTKPQQDRGFMKAVKENRVLTVIHQRLNNKKDYGRIGFEMQPQAAYLVFPKPLPRERDARVIGIHYELLAQSKPTIQGKRLAAPKRMAEPAKPEKRITSFQVWVRRTAIFETTLSVVARNKKEAQHQAIETSRREPFDASRAVVTTEVKAIEPG
jgi:hypothetical protein